MEPDNWSGHALISLNELRRIHFTAMTPVGDIAPHPDAGPEDGPGSFRRHDLHPFSAGMTPPSWTDVPAAVRSWIDDVEALRTTSAVGSGGGLPVPEQLAHLHAQFERVHPFIDGNGRTGRLALNLLLVRLGYPPVIILKRQRERYLQGLMRADAGTVGPLGELLAQAMLDNLNRFIVPSVAGPARLVPLAALISEEFSHIKTTGSHPVAVTLHPGVTANLAVTVVAAK